MSNAAQTVINCIRFEICRQNERIVLPELSARFLIEVYKLSKAHDVAHLVGDVLNKSGVFENLSADIDENERSMITKIKEKFEGELFTAVYRYENINYELERLKEVLKSEKIPFIPLKGSVIRKYYPQPWMRTSSDIDLLIKSEQLKIVINTLVNRLSYIQKGEWIDEISLYSPGGVHLELHCTLVDDYVIEKVDNVLSNIWTYAEQVDGTSEFVLMDEAYYYYHIAHMAKHVMHGGCGVRPFIDLWLLEHKIEHSDEKRNTLLECGGLSKFAEVSRRLSEVWFDGGKQTEATRELENYVLSGGVYGTREQHIAMSYNVKGGIVRHIVSRVFLTFSELSSYYPSLKKCPILFPAYQVRRWLKLIFSRGKNNAAQKIRLNKNISEEKKEAAKRLMDELEL